MISWTWLITASVWAFLLGAHFERRFRKPSPYANFGKNICDQAEKLRFNKRISGEGVSVTYTARLTTEGKDDLYLLISTKEPAEVE